MYLYKLIKNDNIINAMLYEDIDTVLSGLFEFARTYGFFGNLWKLYITYLICCDENPYSLTAEICEPSDDSLTAVAMLDLEEIIALFNADFSFVKKPRDREALGYALDFKYDGLRSHKLSLRIRGEIKNLCELISRSNDVKEAQLAVRGFYQKFGVGSLGLHRAFCLHDGLITPITNVKNVEFDELIGLESQKAALIKNTEAFLDGKRAANVLLYGDAGTGKSTCIKALMNQYFDRGLRVIEIYKHQFTLLNDLISQIKNRQYKFIIFMDDLSFEEHETEYKYLKALIEGGVQRKPDNILIYATSNRRHLIKETFKDKGAVADDDIHKNDTVQEKLSLAYRFGVQLYFPSPDKKEYQRIVLSLGERAKLALSSEELLAEANKWEMRGSGKSGRTARQLIDSLSE